MSIKPSQSNEINWFNNKKKKTHKTEHRNPSDTIRNPEFSIYIF